MKYFFAAVLPLALLFSLSTPLAAEEFGGEFVEEFSEQKEPQETEEAQEAKKESSDSFSVHLAYQAALEIEIGLRFFERGDDYRAITALKRYQLLSSSTEADYLANLLVGEIYRRNDYSDLGMRHFFDASRFGSALSAQQGLGAYQLGLQEFCLSLGAYAPCRGMLLSLEESFLQADLGEEAEVVRYQRHFVDFLFREVESEPPSFENQRLQRASEELYLRNQTFEDLPLKRPALAGALSAILPGTGQVYNGRPLDGALALGITSLFTAGAIYSHFGLESLPLTILSGLFASGFYIGNITNAVVDARRINAQLYDEFFETLKEDLWPRSRFEVRDGEVHYDYDFDWPGKQREARNQEPPPLPDMI